MSLIVSCAGGRMVKSAPKSFAENTFILSCVDDINKTQVKKLQRLGYAIYDKELILTGVLRQKWLLPDEESALILQHADGAVASSSSSSSKAPTKPNSRAKRRRRR
mmetsp:Transcript_27962/g.38659  ORF Transcript_27962/g.38659 Transcript_27962/m.38659 type:complete len:106 (+) Transcript_27962:26-343(+)